MSYFKLEGEACDAFGELIDGYGPRARQVMDANLRNEGAELIKRNIAKILPVSGKKWRGKGQPASAVMPGKFAQENSMLEVTIAARGKYHYLYFPDDGSTTVDHFGDQQFMQRGAEASMDEIIETVTDKLINEFQGGS